MDNMNIGIVNLIVSNKLKDAYFNNKLIKESKNIAFDFLDVVQSSPILQLEFKVFNNLDTKHIENELSATRYIDSNIKLFEVYTLSEIEKEHEKLKPFISEASIPEDNKVLLYNAIYSLIKESLNDYDKIDVDAIHESFVTVLNHVRTPKKSLVENLIPQEVIEDDVIEIAVDKFNQKYESMNEDDKHLFTTLISSNDEQKTALLETYKTETISILENLNKDEIKENISKAIDKVRKMTFIKESIDDDIISLHELKKELM